MTRPKNVLITGANSGLGLEAARQLALRSGYGKILISARSQAKADAARSDVIVRTGVHGDRVGTVLFDLTDPKSIDRAVEDLARDGIVLDAIVLNAGGMSPPDAEGLPRTGDGLTELFAMNVGGHARLVNGLIDRGLLGAGATVVFAGSESARDIPLFAHRAPTLPALEGSLEEQVAAIARGEHLTGRVDPMGEYGLVKLLGTVWMSELTRAHGLRALSISPGMTAGTAGAKDMPAPVQWFMQSVALPLMKLFGRAHDVDRGAARYVQGLEDASLKPGRFYASPAPGLTGPLTLQPPSAQPLLGDAEFARAVGRYLDGFGRTGERLAS